MVQWYQSFDMKHNKAGNEKCFSTFYSLHFGSNGWTKIMDRMGNNQQKNKKSSWNLPFTLGVEIYQFFHFFALLFSPFPSSNSFLFSSNHHYHLTVSFSSFSLFAAIFSYYHHLLSLHSHQFAAIDRYFIDQNKTNWSYFYLHMKWKNQNNFYLLFTDCLTLIQSNVIRNCSIFMDHFTSFKVLTIEIQRILMILTR